MHEPKSETSITPDLLERAKAHDQEALTQLYTLSVREIYRSARSMIRDEELARDIQQNTYLKAFSRLDQLREPLCFCPSPTTMGLGENLTAS